MPLKQLTELQFLLRDAEDTPSDDTQEQVVNVGDGLVNNVKFVSSAPVRPIHPLPIPHSVVLKKSQDLHDLLYTSREQVLYGYPLIEVITTLRDLGVRGWGRLSSCERHARTLELLLLQRL